MKYWVDLLSQIPYFNAEIKVSGVYLKNDRSTNKNAKELDICLEMSRYEGEGDKREYKWREQIKFYAPLQSRDQSINRKFEKKVKVMDKQWSSNELDKWNFFCAQKDRYQQKEVPWNKRSEIKVE